MAGLSLTSSCILLQRNLLYKKSTVKLNHSSQIQALEGELGDGSPIKLEIGSPIIIVEAPKMIKTAASMPSLRVNSGLVNPGDVGRIVARKPKDVWAVRLSIGTYLLDSKCFKPLELEE